MDIVCSSNVKLKGLLIRPKVQSHVIGVDSVQYTHSYVDGHWTALTSLEGCYFQKFKVARLDLQYVGTIVNRQLLVPRRKGASFNK